MTEKEKMLGCAFLSLSVPPLSLKVEHNACSTFFLLFIKFRSPRVPPYFSCLAFYGCYSVLFICFGQLRRALDMPRGASAR